MHPQYFIVPHQHLLLLTTTMPAWNLTLLRTVSPSPLPHCLLAPCSAGVNVAPSTSGGEGVLKSAYAVAHMHHTYCTHVATRLLQVGITCMNTNINRIIITL